MARGLPCSLRSYAGRIKKVTPERSGKYLSSDRARFPPTFVMNDYIAGYLGTAGVIAALRRRAREGGSYHVRVNLTRCAMWFMSLGQVDEAELADPGPESRLGPPETIRAMTPYGDYERLAPLVKLSRTPTRWRDAAVGRARCRRGRPGRL